MGLAGKRKSRGCDAEMHQLFDRGYTDEAAALYDAASSSARTPEATLLRARIALAADQPAAFELLYSMNVRAGTATAVRRDALLGEAYALGGDYTAADDRLESALGAAQAIGDPDLTAEVGYVLARRWIMAGDLDAAQRGLALCRSGTAIGSRLNALYLESVIPSADPAWRFGSRSLVELLRLLDPSDPGNARYRSYATETLATRAREHYLPDVVPEIERQLQGSAWPPAFALNRFQASKALGWTKALQGDYFNAFRYLKESSRVAPSDAWRTMALCDRAYLASAIGETRWARQELLEAEELAGRVVWETCRDQESFALLFVAELYAPIDASRASGWLAQFRRVGESSHARLLLKDERRRALADFSSGVVHAALGNRKVAVAQFESALAAYRKVGFEWRAGRCALRLYDLTRKTAYLDTAQELLRDYSSSWLGDELRARRGQRSEAVDLSPMRERVFRLLCEGRSNEEIASVVGRSKATVANHAKAVLKRFGVSSRSALIAEAMRRGML